MQTRNKSLSLIIEWENVQLSEADRATRMLKTISKQIKDLCTTSHFQLVPFRLAYAGEPAESVLLPDKSRLGRASEEQENRQVEVIVTFNPEVLHRSEVASIVTAGLKEAANHISLQIVEVAGEHYYQMKNIGVQHSKGEMLVFLDSDVIPCDNWLENLLATFDTNPDIRFAGGTTYIDPVNLYSKAFALFWFFPLPPTRAETAVTTEFFANNFACYRSVLEEIPFPKDPRRFRTQCQSLVLALRENGIDFYRNTRCIVSHPAPNGFLHFIHRGFCQGSDRYWFNKFHHRSLSFKVSLKRYWHQVLQSVKNPVNLRKAVQLPVWQIPAAMLIGVTYYTLCLLGELITIAKPGFVKKNFSI